MRPFFDSAPVVALPVMLVAELLSACKGFEVETRCDDISTWPMPAPSEAVPDELPFSAAPDGDAPPVGGAAVVGAAVAAAALPSPPPPAGELSPGRAGILSW